MEAQTNTITLSSGLHAHVLCRHRSTKPFFIHFDLDSIPLIVCGCCHHATMKDSKSTDEIADYMYSHWNTHSRARGNIQEHPSNEALSLATIRQRLKASQTILVNGKSAAKERSLYLTKSEWSAVLQHDINQLLAVEIKACSCCLRPPPSKTLTCCSPAHVITIAGRIAKSKRSMPLLISPTGLDSSNLIMMSLRGIRRMTPPATTPITSMLEGAALNSSVTPPSVHEPASQEATIIKYDQTDTIHAKALSSGNSFPGPNGILTEVSKSGFDIMRFKTESSAIKDFVELAKSNQSLDESVGDMHRQKDFSGTVQGEVKALLLYPSGVKHDPIKYAASHDLKSQNSRDNILKGIAHYYVEVAGPTAFDAIGKSSLLAAISRLPELASVSSIHAKLGEERRVVGFVEFFSNAQTAKRRTSILARVLKVVMTVKLEGHSFIDRAISTIEKQLDEGHVTTETADYSTVLGDIHVYLLALCTMNSSGGIRSILSRFTYTFERASGSGGANKDDGDDEDEVDIEPSENPVNEEAGNSDGRKVFVTSPSSAAQVIKTMLHVCKASVAIEIMLQMLEFKQVHDDYCKELDIANDINDTMGGDITEAQRAASLNMNQVLMAKLKTLNEKSSMKPIQKVFDAVHLTAVCPDLAMMASRIHTIESANPSVLNLCQKGNPDPWGPTFSFGADVINGTKLQACGRRFTGHLMDIVGRCFGSETEADQLMVRNLVTACSDACPFQLIEDTAGTGVTLNFDIPECKVLKARAEQAFIKDPASFIASVEKLREVCIGGIATFGSGTMRTKDLGYLSLGTLDGTNEGNMFGCRLKQGRRTLIIINIVNKTLTEGFDLVHPLVARFVVVLVRLLAPIAFKHAISTVQDEFSDAGLFPIQELRSLYMQEVCPVISRRTRLRSSFLSKLAQYKDVRLVVHEGKLIVETSRLVVHQWDATLFEDINQLDIRTNILRGHVFETWGLFPPSLTVPKFRNLFVNIRISSNEFIEAQVAKDGDENQKELCRSLTERTKANSESWMAASGFFSSGAHSFQTMATNYASGNVYGRKSRAKVSDLCFQTSSILIDNMSVICGLPSLISSTSSSQPSLPAYEPPISSVKEKLREKNLWPKESVSSQTYLKGRLAQKLEGRQFLSSAQLEASVAVFEMKAFDVVLNMPCGSGKSLAFALPLSIYPTGGIVLVICPYRNLVETQIQRFRKMGFKACEFDNTGDRFQPESFGNNIRSPDDTQVEFVFIVTDALQHNAIYRFLRAARLRGKLLAIVVDEAHQIALSKFRAAMNRVDALRNFNVPFVIVSGTLPSPIRRTVFKSLQVDENNCTQVKAKDTAAASRVVSFVRFKDQNPELFVEGIIKKDESKKRVLVFCLTKKLVEALAKHLTSKCTNITVWALHAEMEDQKLRQDILDTLTSQLPDRYAGKQVFVATSVLAEGVDVVDVDQVLIVGGTYRGLTDVVQMASRTSRGRTSYDRISEVVVMLSESYVRNRGFATNTNDPVKAHDEEMIRDLGFGDSSSAEMLVGVRGLSNVFSESFNNVCGRIVLESIWMEDETLESTLTPCRACNRCCRDKWLYHEVFQEAMKPPTTIESSVSGKKRITTNEPQTPIDKSDPELKRAKPDSSIMRRETCDAVDRVEVLKFLNDNAGICLFCNDSAHYPNKCVKFTSSLKAQAGTVTNRRCNNCFQPGHYFTEVQAILTQANEKADAEERMQFKQGNGALNDCAVVYSEHKSYGLMSPCTDCWLTHDSYEIKNSSCKLVNKYTVRACLLFLWFNKDLRGRFLQELKTKGIAVRDNEFENWRDFMSWNVYKHTDSHQNCWYALAFYSSEFKKNFGRLNKKKI